MNSGDRVRLKNDTSRIGILMDQRRQQLSRELVLVRFTTPNRDQWIPIDQLEEVPSLHSIRRFLQLPARKTKKRPLPRFGEMAVAFDAWETQSK